ncbi:MAG: hypothetical protein WD894_06155 [Pirellulales bacterium]
MPQATEVLTERMEQKRAVLAQLRDLGLYQAALIGAGDMAQLLKLLAAKQRLLAALQSLERELDRFRSDDPETRLWTSPGDRRRCAAIAAECEELLRAIVEQERQSESQMQLRREEAAAQLQGAHCAAEVHHAYLAEPFPASSQLDLTQG